MSAQTTSLSQAFAEASRTTSKKTDARRYRNDPYSSAEQPRPALFIEDAGHAMVGGDAHGDASFGEPAAPPPSTLHSALWGKVTFVPYPTEQFVAPSDSPRSDVSDPAANELVRVFVGQLPYNVTDMQLAWLVHTFGRGNAVTYPERIMKRQASGERLPTGCVHAYASRRAVAEMADGMHKRMLVDDTGVWHAQNDEEWAALTDYVGAMKKDKSLRPANRPYDTVVVQFATSTYVPRHVAATPQLNNAISSEADVITVPDRFAHRPPVHHPRSAGPYGRKPPTSYPQHQQLRQKTMPQRGFNGAPRDAPYNGPYCSEPQQPYVPQYQQQAYYAPPQFHPQQEQPDMPAGAMALGPRYAYLQH